MIRVNYPKYGKVVTYNEDGTVTTTTQRGKNRQSGCRYCNGFGFAVLTKYGTYRVSGEGQVATSDTMAMCPQCK